MFSDSRYVVIDDIEAHLRILVNVLHSLRAPCRGILYDGEKGIEAGELRGVRILFLDIHLQGSRVGSGAPDHALIARLIETGINPVSGPFLLVLWTGHPEEAQPLVQYIEKAVLPDRRPLAVVCLEKNKYLVGDVANETNLRQDVESAIESDPRIQALFSWERDVLAAAGATLAELGALVPPEDRTAKAYSASLDGILSLLAMAAVGEKNATRDPRTAVSAALAPILADRVMNQKGTGVADIWREAVTRVKTLPELSPVQAGRMNSMLHLASPSVEAIRCSDWGAVVRIPDSVKGRSWQRRFGLTKGEALWDVFRISASSVERCRFVLVRIGAACDYAQGRKGPVPYVLGVLRPLSVLRTGSLPSGEAVTPLLMLNGEEEPVQLITNARFVTTFVTDTASKGEVLFRIRQELLTTIVTTTAAHTTRPGILEFRPPK